MNKVKIFAVIAVCSILIACTDDPQFLKPCFDWGQAQVLFNPLNLSIQSGDASTDGYFASNYTMNRFKDVFTGVPSNQSNVSQVDFSVIAYDCSDQAKSVTINSSNYTKYVDNSYNALLNNIPMPYTNNNTISSVSATICIISGEFRRRSDYAVGHFIWQKSAMGNIYATVNMNSGNLENYNDLRVTGTFVVTEVMSTPVHDNNGNDLYLGGGMQDFEFMVSIKSALELPDYQNEEIDDNTKIKIITFYKLS